MAEEGSKRARRPRRFGGWRAPAGSWLRRAARGAVGKGLGGIMGFGRPELRDTEWGGRIPGDKGEVGVWGTLDVDRAGSPNPNLLAAAASQSRLLPQVCPGWRQWPRTAASPGLRGRGRRAGSCPALRRACRGRETDGDQSGEGRAEPQNLRLPGGGETGGAVRATRLLIGWQRLSAS